MKQYPVSSENHTTRADSEAVVAKLPPKARANNMVADSSKSGGREIAVEAEFYADASRTRRLILLSEI